MPPAAAPNLKPATLPSAPAVPKPVQKNDPSLVYVAINWSPDQLAHTRKLKIGGIDYVHDPINGDGSHAPYRRGPRNVTRGELVEVSWDLRPTTSCWAQVFAWSTYDTDWVAISDAKELAPGEQWTDDGSYLVP
jgi:hypothetical protein